MQIWPCQRRRKCVKLYIIRFNLMDVGVYITLWLLWTKRQCHKPNQCSVGKTYFQHIEKNWCRHFLTCDFSNFYALQKKTNGIFGIPRKILVRNACYLCKNIDLKICPYLTWPPSSQVKWRDTVKGLSPSIFVSKIAQKTFIAPHVCNFYFIATCCNLTLTSTFLTMPFSLMQYTLWTSAQHFGWVWPLCSQSKRPESPKCENA